MAPCTCTTTVTTTVSTCPMVCVKPEGVPENTVPMTIQAKHAKKGDWLNCDANNHLLFADADQDAANKRQYWLHVKGSRPLVFAATEHVKVWRPVENCNPRDVRPFDVRKDVPCRTLTDAHRLGASGLAATFPVGSVWEVGPFVHDRDPQVVRIMGAPYNSPGLINHSTRPEDAEAHGAPSWFLPVETLYSPVPRTTARAQGREGQPPGVLAALTPQMAVKAGVACCNCADYVEPLHGRVLSCNAGVIQVQRAEIAALTASLEAERRRADDLAAFANKLRKQAKQAEDDFAAISRGVYAAREALATARSVAISNLRK